MSSKSVLWLFVLGCAAASCKSNNPKKQEAPAPEAWATKPPGNWPQLVLTNEADFKGHTPLRGASSFLVRGPDGKTYIATARHLIGAAGGVEPKVPLRRFDEALTNWTVYPRTLPKRRLQADRLALSEPGNANADWLAMSTKETGGEPPAYPLTLRKKPVEVGERVLLVGCPYSESDCVQNVYEGTVTERGHGDRFRYELDVPVTLNGFSGAPIIDANGHVVGVMTIWFDRRLKGKLDLDGGAEDAVTAVRLLGWN